MIHVLGANSASLTLCDELSRCATPFEIIPLGSPGSGWAGLTWHGELLDLGQRYFELGFEANEEKPLAQYNEAESQRDFVHHVRDFIERHGFTYLPGQRGIPHLSLDNRLPRLNAYLHYTLPHRSILPLYQRLIQPSLPISKGGPKIFQGLWRQGFCQPSDGLPYFRG